MISIEWSNLFYFLFIATLFTFLSGLFFKDFKFNNLKNHLLDKSLIITLLIFIIGLYLLNDALQQAAFTFSSVYLGFWLSAQINNRADRQKFKIYLGLLWQELRYNKYQLEQIKDNYRFNILSSEYFRPNFIRFYNIYTATSFLKNEIYQSYIVSGAITTLASNILKDVKESDALFEIIESSYTDLSHLKSLFSFIKSDFETKERIQQEIPSLANNSDLLEKVKNDIETKIIRVAKEIAICYRDCINAIDIIDKALIKLKVYPKESYLKEEILNDEDNEFINNSLREIPENVIENPFQD